MSHDSPSVLVTSTCAASSLTQGRQAGTQAPASETSDMAAAGLGTVTYHPQSAILVEALANRQRGLALA
jgi:hypothetical protein